MIINMRYHLDGEKLLVRWNYKDVDASVTSSCYLCKCINDEIVEQSPHISLTSYRNNGGGCEFTLPRIPVYILVKEDGTRYEAKARVWETPRYHLNFEKNMHKIMREPPVRKLFFSKEAKYVPGLSMSLVLPDQLSTTEAESIPGWLFRGKYGKDMFFWPNSFLPGKNQIKPFEVDDEHADQQITIDIAENEAQGTRFKGLFCFGEPDPFPPRPVNESEVRKINLMQIARKNDRGFFPVRCPFCLKEWDCGEPVFRSKIYEDGNGYPGEDDDAYKSFYDDVGGTDADSMSTRGKVLLWSDKTDGICEYRLLGSNEWVKNDNVLPDSPVLAVRDKYGNESSDKICPGCHHPLPLLSGKYPTVMLTLMGNTGAGKTVYIARLAQQIMTGRLLPGYKMGCVPNQNPATIEICSKYNALEGRISSDKTNSKTEENQTDGFGSFRVLGQNGFGVPGGRSGFGNIPHNTRFGSPNSQLSFGEEPKAGFQTLPVSDRNTGNSIHRISGGFEFGTQAADNNIVQSPFVANGGGFGGRESQHAEPSFEGNNGTGQASVSFTPGSFTRNNIKTPKELDPQMMIEATARTYREPFVFQLSAADESQGGMILVINDFPGEAIWDPMAIRDRFTTHFEKILKCVDGVIFLFDPMTIQYIENLGEKKKREFAYYLYNNAEKQGIYNDSPLKILTTFQTQYYPTGPMTIPVVYALSKSDAIRDHLPELTDKVEDLRFLDESANSIDSHHTGVDIIEMEQSSRAICEFMQDDALVNSASFLARDSIWMCLSATGVAPENGTMKGRYGGAVRILDPVEWILYRMQSLNGD